MDAMTGVISAYNRRSGAVEQQFPCLDTGSVTLDPYELFIIREPKIHATGLPPFGYTYYAQPSRSRLSIVVPIPNQCIARGPHETARPEVAV